MDIMLAVHVSLTLICVLPEFLQELKLFYFEIKLKKNKIIQHHVIIYSMKNKYLVL